MLKDLVKANRSYRGYDESRKVSEEELKEMIDCARFSASSVNRQPLQYYLAWEKEDVDRIQKMTVWAKGLPEVRLPHEGMRPTAFIVICQNRERYDALGKFQRDVGIAAQTILLAATEMGLGGCMIGSFNAEEVKKELRLAEELVVQLIVAIGKPAETIVITEISDGESTKYYRDDNDVHYVPKRKLEDLIIKH